MILCLNPRHRKGETHIWNYCRIRFQSDQLRHKLYVTKSTIKNVYVCHCLQRSYLFFTLFINEYLWLFLVLLEFLSVEWFMFVIQRDLCHLSIAVDLCSVIGTQHYWQCSLEETDCLSKLSLWILYVCLGYVFWIIPNEFPHLILTLSSSISLTELWMLWRFCVPVLLCNSFPTNFTGLCWGFLFRYFFK